MAIVALTLVATAYMMPSKPMMAPGPAVRSSFVRMQAATKTAVGTDLAGKVVPAAPAPATQPVSSCLTPKETFEALVAKGVGNSKMSNTKVLFNSIMGGCYVGIGGLLSLSIAGSIPGVAATNPGFVKFIFAALFPVNLLMVLQTGGQLFTGNTANMAAAYFEDKVDAKQVARSWSLSWVGNFIGCGLLALAAAYCGLLTGGVAELASGTVMKKCSMSFGPTLVKAILCNWLVCIAVYLATQAQSLGSKMVGIWFPISTFVAIGFEHSVANMFIMPAGLIAAAPIGIGAIFLKNLIPVTIGNAIAGALIIGAGQSFTQGKLGKGK